MLPLQRLLYAIYHLPPFRFCKGKDYLFEENIAVKMAIRTRFNRPSNFTRPNEQLNYEQL
jgi:hypothetical protein